MALKKVDAQFVLDIILPKNMYSDPNTPTDSEATALYSLWKESPPGGVDRFIVPAQHKPLINAWKAKGLVHGFSDSLELTDKGRKLIIEMVTNEPNSFEKKAQMPRYSDVRAKKEALKEARVKKSSINGSRPFNMRKIRSDSKRIR